jgi:hypothetical protein
VTGVFSACDFLHGFYARGFQEGGLIQTFPIIKINAISYQVLDL